MKKIIVVLATLALVGAFAGSAMAADWAFYGSARMSTFWTSVDNGTDDDDLGWDLQGNSRIGATVKHDAVTGGFEYGTGVNVRKLYGEWNFGSGKLLAGQTYTPITFFYSGQVYGADNGLLDGGAAYGGRRGMLQLSFGSFKFAAVQPVLRTVAGGDQDTYLPRFEASWTTGTDQFNFDLFGGFQSYDIDAATDMEVTSYVLGFSGKVNFGAAWLAGGASIYQNGDDAGWLGGGDANLNALGTDVADTDAWMAFVAFGFKASDMVSFEVGLGYKEEDPDLATAADIELLTIYANLPLTIGPGVYVIPEVGYMTEDNSNVDTFYLGAKWQINF
jgi:hypothetical protein